MRHTVERVMICGCLRLILKGPILYGDRMVGRTRATHYPIRKSCSKITLTSDSGNTHYAGMCVCMCVAGKIDGCVVE